MKTPCGNLLAIGTYGPVGGAGLEGGRIESDAPESTKFKIIFCILQEY